ncbi:hypothetical protein, partial [Pseudomonas protegens]|uniref:hypothetical protein n=1 Tax=Pseudomonas protegens TaxID=380021 RepID=UPI00223BB1C2
TGLSRRGSRVRVPSAAPYSVTWNTERQVTTESPLARAFCCKEFVGSAAFHGNSDFFDKIIN